MRKQERKTGSVRQKDKYSAKNRKSTTSDWAWKRWRVERKKTTLCECDLNWRGTDCAGFEVRHVSWMNHNKISWVSFWFYSLTMLTQSLVLWIKLSTVRGLLYFLSNVIKFEKIFKSYEEQRKRIYALRNTLKAISFNIHCINK